MSNKQYPNTNLAELPIYQIRVEGHLGPQWQARFDGLTMTRTHDGDTLLTGPVVDQAALYGWLRKVRDSGMILVAVHRIDSQK